MRALGPLTAILTLSVTAHLFAASPPATAPNLPSHDAMVTMYLEGKWDDLNIALIGGLPKELNLPVEQRTEDSTMRLAMAECKPAWWKTAKLGKAFTFQPVVWGHTINANYDPNRTDMQLSTTNGHPYVTIGWPAADFDSDAKAEHGFTKGELLDLGIWNTLGMADSWAAIPVASQTNMDDTARLRLNRYLDFRGDVAGLYYSTPRARRWGLWLYLYMYNDKYAQMDNQASRRSLGVLLISEVIAHPDKYPSMKIPPEMKDAGESKIADRLRAFLEKNEIPLAEDKTLREALKAFAAANELSAFKSGQVLLPNKQVASFDPKIDLTLRTKREAWIKDQLSKPPSQ